MEESAPARANWLMGRCLGASSGMALSILDRQAIWVMALVDINSGRRVQMVTISSLELAGGRLEG